MSASGTGHGALSQAPILRGLRVEVVAGSFATGGIGAAVVGFAAGFSDTDDPSVLPVRLGGALLTGFVAGLMGGGFSGWIATWAGATVAVFPFATTFTTDSWQALAFALASSLVLVPGFAVGYLVALGRRLKGGDDHGLPGNVPRPNWPTLQQVDDAQSPLSAASSAPALPTSLAGRGGPAGWAAMTPQTMQRLYPPKRRWLTGARFAAILVGTCGPLVDLMLFWGLAESGALSEDADRAVITIAALIVLLVGSFLVAGLLLAVDGRGVRGAMEALVIAVPGAWLAMVSSTEDTLQTAVIVGVAFGIVAAPVEAGYLMGRLASRLRGTPTPSA